MRTVLFVSVLALTSVVTSCSIDVDFRDLKSNVNTPVYPNARVTAERPAEAHVGFSGSFAGTNVVSSTFESDDTPEMILEFYRQMLRRHGTVVECRGTFTVRRQRRVETLVCLEQDSSQMMQIAGGVEGQHSVVAVTPRGSATRFTVLDVHTRG